MKPAHVAISSSLLALALCFAPLSASAQVFKCIGANGKITYSNDRGSEKECKQISSEQAVSTINMRPNPSQATFPRVSDEAQRERDNIRRRVLEKELDSERQELEGARSKLAEEEAVRYGDEKNYQRVLERLQPYKEAIERRERNIEALTQELSGLR